MNRAGTWQAILWIAVLEVMAAGGCAAPERGQSGDAARRAELTPLLDEDAALRAAREFGMQAGLAEWAAELTEYSQERIVWRLTNTTYERVDGRGGQVYVIDADTGALVDTLRWASEWLVDDPGPPRVTPGQ